MSFGICQLSLIPLRSETSHRSEMVSQLLFGEHYEIKETIRDWIRIKSAHDGYEGFMPVIQHTELQFNDYNFLQKQ